MQERIHYEQPLNERMRTFLRLEGLFSQARHTLWGHSPWDSRATLGSILDLHGLTGRADIKNDVIKELERHISNLARLSQSPGVDRRRLEEILEEMEQLTDQLGSAAGKVGQSLHHDELLNSIRQRSSLPGGAFDFDLPAYQYWLERPAERRTRDLNRWLAEFEAIRLAVELILRLIRRSTTPTQELAPSGFYQQSLDQGMPFQLVRIALPHSVGYYPEISAGRHRFTVRFLTQIRGEGTSQVGEDVPFELSCCAL